MKAENYVKPFGNFSHLWAFVVMPFNSESFRPVWKLLLTAWQIFIRIQNKRKLGISKIKIISVDHELDRKIPFVPENVKIYMDFVNFFCRIMRMFVKKLGLKKGMPLNIKIIDFIRTLYENATKIYLHALSTTDRPLYLKKPKFLLIHFFDPHLLCVPSLHVAIAIGVWAKVREILTENFFTAGERKQILDEIYYGSIAITESVLYVKQHSINCVAGSLYMLSSAYDENFFPEDDCKNVIQRLFSNADDISREECAQIQEYIKTTYKKLREEYKKSQGEWVKPLQLWLDNYS